MLRASDAPHRGTFAGATNIAPSGRGILRQDLPQLAVVRIAGRSIATRDDQPANPMPRGIMCAGRRIAHGGHAARWLRRAICSRTWFWGALLAVIAGCGGSGGHWYDGCSPAPSISSTPDTVAYVGKPYVYGITAFHLCDALIPFPCANVDAIRVPAGATFSDTQAPYILWTPSLSQANTYAAFEIATKTDACGGRATQSWTVYVVPDTTPPSVNSVSPRSGTTNVAINSSITAIFSEPIDPQSVTSTSFTVTGPAGVIPGSVAVNGSSATFIPAADLPTSSSISTTLTSAIKDLSGNALTSTYAWTFTSAAAPATPPPGWTWNVFGGSDIYWTSIALDSSDHVYIAYQSAFGLGRYATGRVLVLTNASGSWNSVFEEEIAPDWYAYSATASVSLLINVDASAHVAYLDYSNRQLKHATNKSGSWVSEIVDSNVLPKTLWMAHDGASHLHLIYNGKLGAVTATYATNASSVWVNQSIGSDAAEYATSPAIAVDPYGNTHVAYYDAATAELKHVTNASGAWVTEVADNQGDVGRYVSIASDTSGSMHLSYYDASNGALKYATNATGLWVTEIVDNVGDVGVGTAIALDASDHVHIGYTDATNHALKYATNATGAWQTLIVDGASYVGGIVASNNGYPSIAVDSTDKVHISYRGDGRLKYATNR